MSFVFRPAIRENVGLLIGLAGPTGSGKTYSALRLARGLAGGKPFAVIDTEHGRAKIYADEFEFHRCDLDEPFSPARYAEAIGDAIKADFPVIVVDSMSHEYSGEGGIVDWHDKEVDAMVERALKRKGEDRPDWQLRESYNWPAWSAPKQSHKRDLLSKIIAMPPNKHLILAFRAEPKSAMVEEKTGQGTRKKIVPMEGATGLHGWFPITEKNLPYELTVSHLMLAEKPGVPLYIKCPEKLRAFFPTDKPIDEAAGVALAAWARGGTSVGAERQTQGQTAGVRPDRNDVKSPAADSTGLPSREDMLAAIVDLENGLNLPGKERLALWTKFCGKATETNVDVSALADLAADLRARVKVGA